MIRLIEPLPPDERSIYIGFISLVIGIWVKSPLRYNKINEINLVVNRYCEVKIQRHLM